MGRCEPLEPITHVERLVRRMNVTKAHEEIRVFQAGTDNEHDYAQRRNAILDVVSQLMYSKGYEQMTVLEIVHDLQISKGAFYHYFDSKQAAFSALLERMGQELDQHLLPIVQDSALPALEKLQRFFAALAGWKYERLEILLAVTRIWYSDDNAIIRSQLRQARVKHLAPQLAAIIREGCQQGVLLTDYPEQMGEVMVSLILDLNDALAKILLSDDRGSDAGPRLERTIAAYTQTLLRTLGAPSGSLQLVNTEYLGKWLIEP